MTQKIGMLLRRAAGRCRELLFANCGAFGVQGAVARVGRYWRKEMCVSVCLVCEPSRLSLTCFSDFVTPKWISAAVGLCRRMCFFP